MDEIMSLSLRVNDFLTGLFLGIGMQLVELSLEFGRLWEDEQVRVVLADEISPDSCRLWDMKKGREWLDNEQLAGDLGNASAAYQEVARRLGILPESGPTDLKGPETMQ
jgi:phosphoribosylaminoimidazole-succinocarboxamide synthase